MLTALVAKLRSNHPDADIAMTVPRAIAPLYATRPTACARWRGIRATCRRRSSPSAVRPRDRAGRQPLRWLAAAMRARWIVAFDGDSPRTRTGRSTG
jgi:hypothetical protein